MIRMPLATASLLAIAISLAGCGEGKDKAAAPQAPTPAASTTAPAAAATAGLIEARHHAIDIETEVARIIAQKATRKGAPRQLFKTLLLQRDHLARIELDGVCHILDGIAARLACTTQLATYRRQTGHDL